MWHLYEYLNQGTKPNVPYLLYAVMFSFNFLIINMETNKKHNPISIFIGFKRYSTLEFEKDGFRILFDMNYANKFRNYIQGWGLDEEAVFDDLVKDCYNLIKGEYNKRNDLPMRFTESSRYGTTTNLLNDVKVQFIEDTLFGKEYKSEIHNINVEEEQMIHFFY